MTRTLDEIRRLGLEALRQRLGRAGMIRFLQQFETGSGDYAQARHAWLDATSLDELRRLAGQRPMRSRQQRASKTAARGNGAVGNSNP